MDFEYHKIDEGSAKDIDKAIENGKQIWFVADLDIYGNPGIHVSQYIPHPELEDHLTTKQVINYWSSKLYGYLKEV